MRFINKQKHTRTCGIVAIANLLKAIGRPIGYTKLLTRFKKYRPKEGMTVFEMEEILRLLKIKSTIIFNPTLKDIENNLNENKKCILRYTWYDDGTSGNHFVFINSHTNKILRAYNKGDNTKTPFMLKRELTKYFQIGKRHGNIPHLFII